MADLKTRLYRRLQGPQDVGVRQYTSPLLPDTWICTKCRIINSVIDVNCRNPFKVCTAPRPAYLQHNPIPMKGKFTALLDKDKK